MAKLFATIKKIHRFLVLFIVPLSLIMATTGFFLRYPSFSLRLFAHLNFASVRSLHRQFSTYFTIVLCLMVFTGLILYILPPLMRRRSKELQQPSTNIH